MKKMLKKIKQKKHFLRNLGILCVSLFIVGTSIMMIWLANLKLPDFQSFEERKIENSTQIYDRTGKVLLYSVHQDIKRTIIPFADMGDNIKHATLSIEDDKFYQHNGIRITSIIRALLSNLTGGQTQGGSTITQQVIKNNLLTQEKTLTRKLKEWILALKLERVMSKDDIFALYLNNNPYGGNIYGIEEASHTFFDKDPKDLTIAEAAYLAAIPQSPTYYSPFGTHRDQLDARKNLVLSKMNTLGYIDAPTYESAKNEVVTFKPREATGIKAPHFVFFVLDYLNQKYGEDVATSGGLKVITTLDYDLQQKAEEIVARYAKENEEKYKASNAGVVVIDPKTGQILTMVGSRNYFDKDIDGNYNITLAKRQPGSSFKPFIYATAFNMGYTPETVLFDLKTEFSTTCSVYGVALGGNKQSSCYSPQNYDGKYRGPISLRNALAQSINIPAIKLLYLVGIKNAIKTAREMGITTLSDNVDYGLTLVLGGGEVTPLEMTSAYSAFATGGIKHSYARILQVTDSSGQELESYTDQTTTVLPKNTTLQISSVLSDNTARTPIFGARSALYFPDRQVAVKTGTTNNNKDAWILGYTPSITVGAWAGNNDNTPMSASASNVVARMWHEVIDEALKNTPNETFESPEKSTDMSLPPFTRGVWQGNESFFVDTTSGSLATSMTPPETRQEKVVTNVHSILYWVNRANPLQPKTDSPQDDPQFTHWEIPVQNWWAANSGNYQIITEAEKPTTTDSVHTSNTTPQVTIVNPLAETEYNKNQPLPISLQINSAYPINKVDYFVNDTYLGTATTAPFGFTFTPSDIPSIGQDNTLRAIVTNSVFGQTEVTKIFAVGE